jgi:hypothetical protein
MLFSGGIHPIWKPKMKKPDYYWLHRTKSTIFPTFNEIFPLFIIFDFVDLINHIKPSLKMGFRQLFQKVSQSIR